MCDLVHACETHSYTFCHWVNKMIVKLFLILMGAPRNPIKDPWNPLQETLGYTAYLNVDSRNVDGSNPTFAKFGVLIL